VHGELRARNAHPSYAAAKVGDAEAAKALVDDLIDPRATEQLAN